MQKILLSIFAFFLILSPVTVGAKLDLGQARVEKAAGTAGYDKATETSLAELIGTIIKSLLSFAGVIFLILTVYAGFLWMTAQGEETKIEKAQGIIKSSVVGLVVMMGAYSITAFVVPMILDKTAGNNGPENGPSGEETIACCTVCIGNTCTSSEVPLEADCEAKPECGGPNVGANAVSCSVTASPRSQCGGSNTLVNCCTITTKARGGRKEKIEKQIVQSSDECDTRYQNISNGFNADYDQDYNEGVVQSQCQ